LVYLLLAGTRLTLSPTILLAGGAGAFGGRPAPHAEGARQFLLTLFSLDPTRVCLRRMRPCVKFIVLFGLLRVKNYSQGGAVTFD
jgi:hypothetical protein